MLFIGYRVNYSNGIKHGNDIKTISDTIPFGLFMRVVRLSDLERVFMFQI